MDPVFGFQAVNVEAQLRSPTSLLRWLHRFIALRKEHHVFGLGSYEPIETIQPSDLRPHPPARGRSCAVRAQPRALGPGRRAGPRAPTRGAIRSSCSAARASHGSEPAVPAHACAARLLLVRAGRPERRSRIRAGGRRKRREAERRCLTSSQALTHSGACRGSGSAEWLSAQRWYAAKSRAVLAAEPVERLVGEDPSCCSRSSRRSCRTARTTLYQLPLALTSGRAAAATRASSRAPASRTCATRWPTPQARARADAADRRRRRGRRRRQGRYSFHASSTRARWTPARARGRSASSSRTARSCSTSASCSRCSAGSNPGINPELEVLRFLAAHASSTSPRLHGWYEYEGRAARRDARDRPGVPRATRSVAGSWGSRGGSDPDAFLRRARRARRGHRRRCTACSPATPRRPGVRAAEQPSHEWMSLVTASLDEEIQDTFTRLPVGRAARRRSPARAQEVRGRLAAIAQFGLGGRTDPHPRRLPPRSDAAIPAAAGF